MRPTVSLVHWALHYLTRIITPGGSVLPESGCTPINGLIDDKQSVDLDSAVHHMCVCVCTERGSSWSNHRLCIDDEVQESHQGLPLFSFVLYQVLVSYKKELSSKKYRSYNRKHGMFLWLILYEYGTYIVWWSYLSSKRSCLPVCLSFCLCRNTV